MPICPYNDCDQRNSDKASFCGRCGRPIDVPQSPPRRRAASYRRRESGGSPMQSAMAGVVKLVFLLIFSAVFISIAMSHCRAQPTFPGPPGADFWR